MSEPAAAAVQAGDAAPSAPGRTELAPASGAPPSDLGAPAARGEDAASLRVTLPSAPPPPPPPPERAPAAPPRATTPPPRGSGTRPTEPRPTEPRPTEPRPTEPRPAEPPPAARPAPETPAAQVPGAGAVPGESEAEARAGVAVALADASARLSGRDGTAAAALLDGEVAGQWSALMREGRISVALDGAPRVQLAGAAATAEVDATVTVRSPFGANRRQATRLAARLERSGGRWVVRALRPLGPLTLK